jgi:hypothetical protein
MVRCIILQLDSTSSDIAPREVIGIYLVLACISFWIMNERRKEGNSVNKIISVCCVIIFFCTTIVSTLSRLTQNSC